jgi:large subunit ribosomal protein L29
MRLKVKEKRRRPMPTIRVSELREASSDEVDKMLSELQAELLKLKAMVKAGGGVDNPARIKEVKKSIAKILTIKNERKQMMGSING